MNWKTDCLQILKWKQGRHGWKSNRQCAGAPGRDLFLGPIVDNRHLVEMRLQYFNKGLVIRMR